MTQPSGPRAYAAAHFTMVMDGERVGLFRSIEGGSIKTDVTTYQHGGGYDRWHALGKPKYEDLKLQFGMSMSGHFYRWLSEFFAGKGTRKTGSISAADFDYKERARRDFTGALIKDVQFPKLDGSDKNAAFMTATVAVEDLNFKKGDNRVLLHPSHVPQKVWTSCNFRMGLDGFDCRHVSKIDSFTIKQNILEYHTGTQRAPIKTPSQIEFPNVTFYIPETFSEKFESHFHKRGVRGEVPGRLTGFIEMFDSEKTELFKVDLAGVDILSVTPDKNDASSEEMKQVKIELYVESMRFSVH